MAVGVGIAVVTLTTGYTLAIYRAPIPPTVIAGVGGVIALLGVVTALRSLRSDRCLQCKVALAETHAYFPPDAAEFVRDAASRLDAERLATIPATTSDRRVSASLAICPRCQSVGVLSVTAYDPRVVELVPESEVVGPSLPAFAEFMRRRDEQRRAAEAAGR